MGRSPCCDKNNGLKRGPWTTEEDQLLVDYITKHGYGNWRTLPKNAGLQRCGKSCRLRWTNYLRPDIKRGRFSSEEEDAIIHLHSILGNKWSAIASRLPGRTDNEIKNYWNTNIRKRLLRMGIDPVTHCPRLDLLDLSSILNSSYYCNSGFDGCSPDMNFSRYLHRVEDSHLVNPDLLKLATSLFSSRRHENSNLENPPCEAQVQVQGHPFAQSQFGCDQEGLQFTDFAQLEQIMNDDWESRSGLCTASLDEDYAQIDFPSHVYPGSLDGPTPPEENFPTFSAYDGIYGTLISSCSATPINSNSNSTTTYINSSANEDEREISYCSSNIIEKFEMAPIDDAFDVSCLI